MSTATQPCAQLDQVTDERDEAAARYIEQLRAFQAHACVFAVGMLIIVAVNLLTNLAAGLAGEWSAWWSAWSLLGWGLGISVHGLVVRLNRPSSSTMRWQQAQIDALNDPGIGCPYH